MTANAFVFARGGSKGLPGKNIRLLAGKPLICYAIEIAQQTPEIERVFVSTEDDAIAHIAETAGATIICRPAELAGDTSPEWLAWRHAIEHVFTRYGRFDTFVSLPATSPLRSVDDVSAAILRLEASLADICISVTAANRSPFFNMVKKDEQGFVELVNKFDAPLFRRQDAPAVFDITTVVYAVRPDFVLKYNSVFDGRVACVEVPKARAVDIDDIYDFMLAEAILNAGLAQ